MSYDPIESVEDAQSRIAEARAQLDAMSATLAEIPPGKFAAQILATTLSTFGSRMGAVETLRHGNGPTTRSGEPAFRR